MTASIETLTKTARQQFILGNYDASVASYRLVINKLSERIHGQSNASEINFRNKLVELRNSLREEVESIETELLPLENQVKNRFENALSLEASSSDSPPADPTVRPIPSSNPRNAASNPAQRKSLTTRSAPAQQLTKKPVVDKKKGVQTKVKQSSAGDAASATANAYGSVLAPSTSAHEDGSGENGEGEKVFDATGYEPELVALIQGSILQQNQNSVMWKDVAGLESVKALLSEAIVLPMEYPDLFKGIRRPWRGICMFGPPGTGKTLLAKAVANECRTTFFSMSAATLTSKYRGDSEKLVRLLFDMARFHSPATIFIDEIDSICSRRGSDSEHEASRRVKSELLIQMDGCSADNEKTILVLAATNFPWDLDEALRRRLEKRIYIPLPDFEARLALLRNSLEEVQLASDVNFEVINKKLEGYSGSDITNICRDAAMGPMRECLQNASSDDLEARRRALDGKPDLTIRMHHFLVSMQKTMPSVSQDTVSRYVSWMEEFGSK
ncbi:ATPase family associated with various cellular activities (AAA) domain-containing protein [Ditylenchus destructor]|uniref:Katanin p60 ATPase-containing subunit A1 n=1 Tax=Ditylenchus destructor TaxID=166010 RepID=A0AAD4NED1_9BILA|nr:ATPase family associated with various cellular activities (AAA) domain-containing protein [Ditylenchus destructor]